MKKWKLRTDLITEDYLSSFEIGR